MLTKALGSAITSPILSGNMNLPHYCGNIKLNLGSITVNPPYHQVTTHYHYIIFRLKNVNSLPNNQLNKDSFFMVQYSLEKSEAPNCHIQSRGL